MKVLSLNVSGFRSLKDIKWKPGDLNVLIGPNASGKSNLLALLELIAISAQGGLGKHIQRCGGMEPLVYDGRAESIEIRIAGLLFDKLIDKQVTNLTYEMGLERLGRTGAFYVLRELLVGYGDHDTGREREPVQFLERHALEALMLERAKWRQLVGPQDLPQDETLLSYSKGVRNALPEQREFQNQVSSWAVYPSFSVDRDAKIRQPMVSRLEERVDPDGQNLISVLHTLYTGNRDFKRNINDAMKAAFGDDFEELVFPPASDQRIQLRIRWKSLKREQSAADLSDGTLRFLFLLTVLATPSPAPLIAIDEPETGLHPSMLPIVAEYAVEASRKAQVVFSTHSPQFLDAFRDTQPVTTVVKWEDGQTVLRNFDHVKLREWLKEYSLGNYFQSGELEDEA